VVKEAVKTGGSLQNIIASTLQIRTL